MILSHSQQCCSPAHLESSAFLWILIKTDDLITAARAFSPLLSRSKPPPAGSWSGTTQIGVPINTNLGRGQRSEVTGLRCNDPSTAGHSLYRNVLLTMLWLLCYWPHPHCFAITWRQQYTDNWKKFTCFFFSLPVCHF